MSNFFRNVFEYEEKTFSNNISKDIKTENVNHICIHEDCVIFNDIVLPFGAKDIEEKTTFIIDDILQEIIHIIQKPENKEKKIIICGSTKARRMLGRKLEDRLKREINY